MKTDKRIIQSLDYKIKKIKINQEAYNKLEEETKEMLKMRKTNIEIDNSIKEFKVIF